MAQNEKYEQIQYNESDEEQEFEDDSAKTKPVKKKKPSAALPNFIRDNLRKDKDYQKVDQQDAVGDYQSEERHYDLSPKHDIVSDNEFENLNDSTTGDIDQSHDEHTAINKMNPFSIESPPQSVDGDEKPDNKHEDNGNGEGYSFDEDDDDEMNLNRYTYRDYNITITALPRKSLFSRMCYSFSTCFDRLQQKRKQARQRHAERALEISGTRGGKALLCLETWCDLWTNRGMFLVIGLIAIFFFSIRISASSSKLLLAVGITLTLLRFLWWPIYWFLWGRRVALKRRNMLAVYDGLNGEAGTSGFKIPIEEYDFNDDDTYGEYDEVGY